MADSLEQTPKVTLDPRFQGHYSGGAGVEITTHINMKHDWGVNWKTNDEACALLVLVKNYREWTILVWLTKNITLPPKPALSSWSNKSSDVFFLYVISFRIYQYSTKKIWEILRQPILSSLHAPLLLVHSLPWDGLCVLWLVMFLHLSCFFFFLS